MEHILTIKELEFRKKKNLNQCLFATGGKDKINYNINTRKSGSAALDMAYVGAGRYDGYFQKSLNIWDIAAGIIFVKEAGGKINDIDYSGDKEIKIITGSNAIYDKMQENLYNF